MDVFDWFGTWKMVNEECRVNGSLVTGDRGSGSV